MKSKKIVFTGVHKAELLDGDLPELNAKEVLTVGGVRFNGKNID